MFQSVGNVRRPCTGYFVPQHLRQMLAEPVSQGHAKIWFRAGPLSSKSIPKDVRELPSICGRTLDQAPLD
jgi:hypothetical protein